MNNTEILLKRLEIRRKVTKKQYSETGDELSESSMKFDLVAPWWPFRGFEQIIENKIAQNGSRYTKSYKETLSGNQGRTERISHEL